MVSGYEFKQKVRQTLQGRTNLYAPLEVASYNAEPSPTQAPYRPDALLTLRWQGKEVSFVAEVKSRTAPKMVQQAIWQLKNYVKDGRESLLILPYLSKSVAEMCTEERLSCIDLNGNYLIQTREILAIRLDKPNAFKESQPIKKIFSGNSSIVGRLLLRERKTFFSLNEVYRAIEELGGRLSLSAISKILKRLEEELIVDKSSDQITLLQPEKLLECLRTEYRAPKLLETQRLKVPLPVISFLRNSVDSSKWTLTGESSAERYSATTQTNILSAYVTDLRNWPQFEEERFYNLCLKKTVDSFVYFDAAKESERWASKIQSYLELSQLDKREKEIAQDLKMGILKGFK